MAKKFNILTRGVSLSELSKLKKLAKSRRTSVNSLMLIAINFYLSNKPPEANV